MQMATFRQFDPGAWTERLAGFARALERRPDVQIVAGLQLGEKADAKAASDCEHALGVALPRELGRFFHDAGRTVRFRYRWQLAEGEARLATCGLSDLDCLWGGPALELGQLPALWAEMRGTLEHSWVAGMEEEREFRLGSLPLMRLDNGDCLAMALGDGPDNGEVRYLPHDGAGEVLADSLGEFLEAWERLGYVGPEIWVLEPFRSPETGRLDASCAKAMALREIIESVS